MDRPAFSLYLVSLTLLVSCSESTSAPEAEPPSETGGEADASVQTEPETDAGDDNEPPAETPAPSCGTAGGELPPGLTVLQWDDGEGRVTVEETDWQVEGVAIASAALHEAVRFELEHPAVIYGFSVQWGALPADDDEVTVTAGLYPDFGYNGFDFWQYEPYWEGTRCLGDIEPGEWVSYVLAEPLEIAQPGLVYVAHHRGGAGEGAWLLDGSIAGAGEETEGDCAAWDACHSALNLPEVGEFFNGVSFPIPYDYLVRLHVAYADDGAAEVRAFRPVDGPSLGRRVAWGDYDNDGWDDLFSSGRLYHNDGDGGGGLIDVTEASGIGAMGLAAHGGTWGDYDNDGCLDLAVFAESYSRGDALLQGHCDGTFSDVTAAAGITDVQHYNDCGDPANINAPTPAVGWWDFDSDGLLDLYLANMICWTDYTTYVDDVWRNDGGGGFSDWSETHGFTQRPLAGRGVHPIDYDQDGDVDLFVNNYTLYPNLFFRNLGGGEVREVAQDIGLAGRANRRGGVTYYGHTIGAAWGDLNNDGHFDMVQANLAHPRFFDFSDKTQVLLNDGRGEFADIQGRWTYPAGEAGLRYSETHSVPVLGDFDQDGALDLAISATYDGRPTDFYWGRGDGTFELDPYGAGIAVENGWGMAAADYDHDGDLDLATSGGLFENALAEEDRGRWLQVQAVGNVDANRAALGATVRLRMGDEVRIRHINGGSGQGCQDALTAHFGLGDVTAVDSIEVDFPGGGTVIYGGPFEVDRRLWVYEDGEIEVGWSPRR